MNFLSVKNKIKIKRFLKERMTETSAGGPVVKSPHFFCKEHEFNPWLGNKDPAS